MGSWPSQAPLSVRRVQVAEQRAAASRLATASHGHGQAAAARLLAKAELKSSPARADPGWDEDERVENGS